MPFVAPWLIRTGEQPWSTPSLCAEQLVALVSDISAGLGIPLALPIDDYVVCLDHLNGMWSPFRWSTDCR
ncbi:MAG: hypothetical protein WCI22_17080, partial [Actinomycetota bacterium]